MIGDIPDQDKVIKFWNGSQLLIQKGLWQDNVNPKILTWEEVVNQAKIIEISENMAEHCDCTQGQANKPGNSATGHFSAHSGAQTLAQDWSVRSVTSDTMHQVNPRGWGHGFR